MSHSRRFVLKKLSRGVSHIKYAQKEGREGEAAALKPHGLVKFGSDLIFNKCIAVRNVIESIEDFNLSEYRTESVHMWCSMNCCAWLSFVYIIHHTNSNKLSTLFDNHSL